MESHQNHAAIVRLKNITEMAIGFTAMMRVFEPNSNQRIAERLELLLPKLSRIHHKEAFEELHSVFCRWFVEDIRTAARHFRNGHVKATASSSYGQAAKVLDIALKVYIHYCQLPDARSVERLRRFLHGAIDTPILLSLVDRFPEDAIKAKTIEGIDESDYILLQRLVAKDIAREFNGEILPVQYDDIMWRRLKDEQTAIAQ